MIRRLWRAASFGLVGLVCAGSLSARTPIQECVVTLQADGSFLSIKQEYGGDGQPTRFTLEYEPNEPTIAADGSRYNVRIWGLAEGSPARADFEANLIDNGIFELRVYLTKPWNRPGMLSFSRGNYINIDLALAKSFLPESIKPEGYLEAIDTLPHWRAFAEDEATLGWAITGFRSYNDIGETGEFPLAAFDKGVAALKGFAIQVGSTDLRGAGGQSLGANCS